MPTKKPHNLPLLAIDFESVLVPEIWISVAEKTGIEDLGLTTRDMPDYEKLMERRIGILRKKGLLLKDIQNVISTLDPLPGAHDFIQKLRARIQLIILSDTFYEFAYPLLKKFDHPTTFCNSLTMDKDGAIIGFHLRAGGKKGAVNAFRRLGFFVVSAGDSYNDTEMLKAADAGFLFNAPDSIIAQFPQFPIARTYNELQKKILECF